MPQADFTASTSDPLWRSLERILSFFQLRLNQELLESRLAIDINKPLAPADIMAIARHMGLDVVLRGVAGIDIPDLGKPALILLPERAYLVALPQAGDLPALWVPSGAVDIDALCASHAKNLYVIEFDRPSRAVLRDDEDVARAHWFWDLLRAYRRDYIDIGLATFFINLFVLITPLFSMTVFDRVIPNHAHETLIALTIGIIVAFTFNFGFKYIRSQVLSMVVARIAARLDTDFMDRLLRLTIPAHKLSIGERFDLFSQLQGLRDFFASRFIPALVDLPFFALFLLVIYMISPGIALVSVLGAGLMILAHLACRIPVNRSAKENFREQRGKNAALVEMLAGAGALRMFNAIGGSLFRWRRLAERSADTARRSQHVAAVADDLALTIMSLTSIFVIVVGVDVIEKGDMSMGGLVACNILVSRTLSPIMNLAGVLGRLRQSLDTLKVIDNLFHMPCEAQVQADYEPKGPFTGAMRLENITFYHPGQVHPTLYRLNLNIRAGEKVGLIGRTGAGKSTITRLLDGFLQPQSGHVFIDGILLNEIHPAEWRQKLGIVPQEPFVFSGSLRENILLGMRDDIDEVWLKQVLTMSGLDLLMKQAGYGLDFDVGEAGARLSGGQRQSLAIARALVRKPNILLLDEPTNGMDNDLELRVKAALHAYTRDKTMILVTHRTTLLGLADRLVLIDQGGVATDGPADDVMRRLSGGAAAHG